MVLQGAADAGLPAGQQDEPSGPCGNAALRAPSQASVVWICSLRVRPAPTDLLADRHRRSPQLSYSLLPAARVPARALHVPVLVPSTCVVVHMVLS